MGLEKDRLLLHEVEIIHYIIQNYLESSDEISTDMIT